MRLVIAAVVVVLSSSVAWGQAGSAAGSGSAGSAADPAPPPTTTPPPSAPPAIDLAASRTGCEAALASPPGGDKRFIVDVQAVARGQIGARELEKTPEGRACAAAIGALDDMRSTLSTAADVEHARKRDAEDLAAHEQAAKAIAKNEKHVVLAYAALWLLAAGFLLFLWRRQQHLKTEIAQLKRDLDAAVK